MKFETENLWYVVLLLVILLIVSAIIEYRKKQYKSELNSQMENFENMISENENISIQFKINKIHVIDPSNLENLYLKNIKNSTPELQDLIKITEDVKNLIGKKVLYIEGSQLKDINAVFIGNLNAKIMNYENKLYIIPPIFNNFDDINYDNLEIKFLIKNNNTLKDPIITSKNNKIMYSNPNTGPANVPNLTGKLEFYITNSENQEFNLKINNDNILNTSNKIIHYLNLNSGGGTIDVEFLPICSPSESDGPSCSDNLENISIIKDSISLKFTFDDLNYMFPTGLFYRINKVDNDLEDSEAWNIFTTKDKIKFNNLTVQGFYDNMIGILDDEKKPEPPKETYNPKNLNIKIDEVNDSLMVLNWENPDKPLTKDFTYVLNVYVNKLAPNYSEGNESEGNESEGNESEGNESEGKKRNFEIKDKKILFEDTKFSFSNLGMFPTEEYIIKLQVYNYSNSKLLDTGSEINYKYMPENLEKYHKHIFKDGKFNIELSQEYPELIKTYYQLNAFNKMKTQENLLNTQEYVNNTATCMNNSLSKVKSKNNKDKFESKVSELLKKEQELDANIFSKKEREQQVNVDRINNKISELEDLQGKLNQNQDLKIKNLKSLNDGTNLSLINLKNNKKMIKINEGCLSRELNGDYNYRQCNVFDKKQYFNLNKINTTDEYNNLLLMNGNPKLEGEESVDYPFYILQPHNSQKCVNIKDKNLSIQPCNDEESIRFQGNFVNQKCSN